MDVDEEKRRGRGAEQSLEGRWSFKENIGIKACLPARCAVILSGERVAVWQELKTGQMFLSTGKEQTCNMPAVIAIHHSRYLVGLSC